MVLSFHVAFMCLSACTVDTHPDEQYADEVKHATQMSSRFAQEALLDNSLTTDLTVKVEINEVIKAQIIDSNLQALTFDTSVVDIYRGVYASRSLKVIRTVASGEVTQYQPGDQLIVSLCLDEENQFYLPDVGYDFRASEELSLYAENEIAPLSADNSLATACREAL